MVPSPDVAHISAISASTWPVHGSWQQLAVGSWQQLAAGSMRQAHAKKMNPALANMFGGCAGLYLQA